MTTVDPRPTRRQTSIPGGLGEVFQLLPRIAAGADDTVHALLCRDLDVASEWRGRAELSQISKVPGVRRIEVTIDPEHFVDIRGLAALIDATRSARQHHCQLVVVDLDGLVDTMVTALRLEDELLVISPPAPVQERRTS
jgi:anti-anti-sigma regulatory factor